MTTRDDVAEAAARARQLGLGRLAEAIEAGSLPPVAVPPEAAERIARAVRSEGGEIVAIVGHLVDPGDATWGEQPERPAGDGIPWPWDARPDTVHPTALGWDAMARALLQHERSLLLGVLAARIDDLSTVATTVPPGWVRTQPDVEGTGATPVHRLASAVWPRRRACRCAAPPGGPERGDHDARGVAAEGSPMTADDRIAELERRVAALEGRTASIERAERELLDAARQWARVKQLGHYLEHDDAIARVSHGDRDILTEGFMSQMRRAALDLLDLEAKPR